MVALLDASVAVVIEASEKGAAGSRGGTHTCVGNGVILGGGWQPPHPSAVTAGETADSLGKTGTIQLRTNPISVKPIQPSNLGQHHSPCPRMHVCLERVSPLCAASRRRTLS